MAKNKNLNEAGVLLPEWAGSVAALSEELKSSLAFLKHKTTGGPRGFFAAP